MAELANVFHHNTYFKIRIEKFSIVRQLDRGRKGGAPSEIAERSVLCRL